VDGVEECAEAISQLLERPEKKKELARKGQQRVKEHFLLPRLLLDHLSLMVGLEKEQRVSLAPGFKMKQDPVCGMVVEESNLTIRMNQQTFFFCSEECQNRFKMNPERYSNYIGSDR
jgi:trehalose synthase